MKIQKKQAIGENLLYVMVWAAIILVPVLNSQMMSEMHVNLENVLIAWRQINFVRKFQKRLDNSARLR